MPRTWKHKRSCNRTTVYACWRHERQQEIRWPRIDLTSELLRRNASGRDLKRKERWYVCVCVQQRQTPACAEGPIDNMRARWVACRARCANSECRAGAHVGHNGYRIKRGAQYALGWLSDLELRPRGLYGERSGRSQDRKKVDDGPTVPTRHAHLPSQPDGGDMVAARLERVNRVADPTG
jgi:hypothetical protein